jgi:hypothetical protein
MSSVTRYWPELASLSSFARILKAYHPFQIESYPPIYGGARADENLSCPHLD